MSEPNAPMSLQAKILVALVLAAVAGVALVAAFNGIDIRPT
jgi:hypothetical protein